MHTKFVSEGDINTRQGIPLLTITPRTAPLTDAVRPMDAIVTH